MQATTTHAGEEQRRPSLRLRRGDGNETSERQSGERSGAGQSALSHESPLCVTDSHPTMSSRLQRLLQLLDGQTHAQQQMTADATVQDGAGTLSDSRRVLCSCVPVGSNPVIRSHAAQQLGELQHDHPEQIHVVLAQLQPYLRSSQWTTRIAAAHALELMCNEMRTQMQGREEQSDNTATMESSSAAAAAVAATSSPAVATAASSSAAAMSSSSPHLLMHLAGFSVDSVIRKGTLMLADAPSSSPLDAAAASSTSTVDPALTLPQRVARQRQELLKRLGLYEEFGGVYESFGGADAILQESDIEPQNAAAAAAPASATQAQSAPPFPASASSSRALSARELNKATRDAKARSKRRREEQEQRDREAIETSSAAPSQQLSGKKARVDVQSLSTDSGPSAVLIESLPVDSTSADPSFALVLSDGSHVLLPFVKRLLWELLDLQWERRHGAAIALRSVMKSQAPWIGRDLRGGLTRDQHAASNLAHAQFLSDCCARLLCVLILDRFADFSDSGCSMVAPVRESAAQILAILSAHLGATDMSALAHCLTQVAEHPQTELRFGAFLAIKYVLAVRFASTDALIVRDPASFATAAAASSATAHRAEVNVAVLTLVLAPLIGALRDPSDDVRSMAADSLSAIVAAIAPTNTEASQRLLPMQQLQALVTALWSSLRLCDDLTSSTSNVLQLLCQLHEWMDRAGVGEKALAACPPVLVLLQSLYPFLSHSVLAVRLHVWRTIRTLLRGAQSKQVSGTASMTTEQLSLVIQLAFQSTLLESDEALQICGEVVALCSGSADSRVPFLAIFDSVAPRCMELMLAPLFQPLPKQLLMRWECRSSSATDSAVTAVAWTSDEHCSLEMKLRGSKLIGVLLSRLARATEPSGTLPQLHPQVQSLLAHLSSPHDLFVQVSCLILCEWWTLSSSSQLDQLSSVATIERSPQWLTALAPLIDPAQPNRPRSANTNALLCQTAIQACVLAGSDVTRSTKQQLLRNCIQPLLFTLEHEAKYPPLQQRCAFYLCMLLQQWVAPSAVKMETAQGIDQDRAAADALVSRVVDMLCVTIPAPQQRRADDPLSSAAAPAIKTETLVKSEPQSELPSDAAMDESELLAMLQADDEAPTRPAAAPATAPIQNPAAVAAAELASKKQRKSKKLKQSDAAIISAAGALASAATVAPASVAAERGASMFFAALCARFQAAAAEGFFECFPRLWDEGIAAPLATLQHPGTDKEQDRYKLCRALQLMLHLIPHLALKHAPLEVKLMQLLPSIHACLFLAPTIAAESASLSPADASTLLPSLTRKLLVLFAQHYTDVSMASLVHRVIPVLTALDPSLPGEVVAARKLAVLELLGEFVSQLSVPLLLPYLPFVIQPVLTCMSDASALALSDDPRLVREKASSVFAQMMPLLPLESGASVSPPANMDASLVALRSERRAFLRQLVDGSRMAESNEALLPAGVLAPGIVLRKYQRDGIRWLRFLQRFALHGVLCDEMGLGKTSQALLLMASTIQERRSALRSAVQRNSASSAASFSSAASAASASAAQFHPLPSLVVCPATLLHHWRSEFGKFVDAAGCPLRVELYEGSAAQKAAIRERMAAAAAVSSATGASIDRDSILLMSYDAARRDAPLFRNIVFLHLTLDEGHLLRNPSSALSRSLKSFRSVHRLILSGTPLSNHVLELWSLFDFLMPGYLLSTKQFARQFATPIQKARKAEVERSSSKERIRDELDSKSSAITVAGNLALESLHKRVLPFLLRRLKSQVAQDLPPKIIQDVLVDLSALQNRMYGIVIKQREEIIARAVENKGGATMMQQKADANDQQQQQHTFQSLQYLRKLCTHPCLVWSADHPSHAAIQSEFSSSSSKRASPSARSLIHAPKLRALRELLLECGIGATHSSVSNMAQGSVDVESLLALEQKSTQKRKQHSGSAAASSSSSASASQLTSLDSILPPHRVLVFAQMKSTLDLVESLLLNRSGVDDDNEEGEEQEGFLPGSVSYLRLDGDVPASKRGALVAQFNSDPSIGVLLLTTAVGGLGLNLSSADTVVMLEHDFDPQRDLQAMDRAHRLGQDRPVNVYRIICRDSLEERIMGLQAFKLHVTNTIINEANASISTMDTSAVVDRIAATAPAAAAAPTMNDAAAASAMEDDSAAASSAATVHSYGDEYDVSSFLRSLPRCDPPLLPL